MDDVRLLTVSTRVLIEEGFERTASKSLLSRSQGVPEIPITGVDCLFELRICRTTPLPSRPGIKMSVITRSKWPS